MRNEPHGNIDDKIDEDELYDIGTWVLIKNNDVSVHLKVKSNIYMISNTK